MQGALDNVWKLSNAIWCLPYFYGYIHLCLRICHLIKKKIGWLLVCHINQHLLWGTSLTNWLNINIKRIWLCSVHISMIYSNFFWINRNFSHIFSSQIMPWRPSLHIFQKWYFNLYFTNGGPYLVDRTLTEVAKTWWEKLCKNWSNHT